MVSLYLWSKILLFFPDIHCHTVKFHNEKCFNFSQVVKLRKSKKWTQSLFLLLPKFTTCLSTWSDHSMKKWSQRKSPGPHLLLQELYCCVGDHAGELISVPKPMDHWKWGLKKVSLLVGTSLKDGMEGLHVYKDCETL